MGRIRLMVSPSSRNRPGNLTGSQFDSPGQLFKRLEKPQVLIRDKTRKERTSDKCQQQSRALRRTRNTSDGAGLSSALHGWPTPVST